MTPGFIAVTLLLPNSLAAASYVVHFYVQFVAQCRGLLDLIYQFCRVLHVVIVLLVAWSKTTKDISVGIAASCFSHFQSLRLLLLVCELRFPLESSN